MYQIVEQTRAERVKMYMRVNKRKLIDMLINCNDIIDAMTFYGAAPVNKERCKAVRAKRPVQQLKAEIAALADRLENDCDGLDAWAVVRAVSQRMQQLSAV